MAIVEGPRGLDLFCGAGGSSCGAKQAGAAIVGGVDLWPLATQTFQLNYPKAQTFTADIVKLCAEKLIHDVGHVELLLASPECTHHSVAKGAQPRDEASKRLAFEVVRFARTLQPRWIVVENVLQMERWPSFPQWLEDCKRLGYRLKVHRLDAHDFGVAQHRRRLFVVGDLRRDPPDPRRYRKEAATAKSILREGDGEPWPFRPLDNGSRAHATLERARRAITALGPRQPFLMVYYGSDGAGGWQTLERPLRTITTLDRFALVKPNGRGHEMRMLQPDELVLAMGFPPTYKWPMVSRRNRIKLAGNAVCPPVVRAIVRALIR